MDLDKRDDDQIATARAEIARLKRLIVTIYARKRQRRYRKAKA